MRCGFLRRAPGLSSQPSLSARGQRANTFAGIGFSAAFLLLAMGGYLIAPQFANPIQDQSLDLPVAALLITTALTLLYGLLHPSRRLRHAVTETPAPIYWEEKNGIVARSALRSRQSANAAAPVRYVDQARIYIRRENGNQARGIAGK